MLTAAQPILQRKVEQHSHPLLFATISGAHLYGFASDDSDFDLRGSHVLPLRQVIGLNKGKETTDSTTIEDGLEIDLVSHDVTKFIGMMLKNNGYVIEQLMSPLIVHTTEFHDELKSLVPACLTRHHIHHYLGFARTQWKLIQKSAEESPAGHPRVKPLLYVYRVLLTGLHLMRTGRMECNLQTLNDDEGLDFVPDLLDLKRTGIEKQRLLNFDEAFHEATVASLTERMKAAAEQSPLSTHATAADALNDLLIRIRLDHH